MHLFLVKDRIRGILTYEEQAFGSLFLHAACVMLKYEKYKINLKHLTYWKQ